MNKKLRNDLEERTIANFPSKEKILKKKFSFTMAQRDYKAILEKWLTRFLLEDDPIKAMLEWCWQSG